jgi:tetratricopeptide (TPR) repeat protein
MLKLYFNASKYAELLDLADKILAQRPDHHEAMFYKALTLSRDIDKQNEAYEVFDKLFHLPYSGKKQESKYHFALGMFAYRMEQYKKAGLAYKACTYLYFKSAAHREAKKILPSDMK